MILQDWILILFCSAIAALTFLLVSKLKFEVTRASSLMGLLLFLLAYLLKNELDELIINQFLVAGFGATFVGMKSPELEKRVLVIALGGLFYGLLFKIGIDIERFNGFGGLVGTMACSGLLASLAITKLFDKIKKTASS